jgi:hypothetical protein
MSWRHKYDKEKPQSGKQPHQRKRIFMSPVRFGIYSFYAFLMQNDNITIIIMKSIEDV